MYIKDIMSYTKSCMQRPFNKWDREALALVFNNCLILVALYINFSNFLSIWIDYLSTLLHFSLNSQRLVGKFKHSMNYSLAKIKSQVFEDLHLASMLSSFLHAFRLPCLILLIEYLKIYLHVALPFDIMLFKTSI